VIVEVLTAIIRYGQKKVNGGLGKLFCFHF